MSEIAFPIHGNPAAENIARLFKEARKFPPALLIEGPGGSGKSKLAEFLAASLLCREEDEDIRPCGRCESCVKLAKRIHPDFKIFESEKKTARAFHVDLIRQLRSAAYIRPNESRFSVFLLEDCETMTEEAQNALLKILEEPPGDAIFILTCKNRQLMLETVRSRVVSLSLEGPDVSDCQESGSAEIDAAAELLSKFARSDDYGALLLLKPYEKDRPLLSALLDKLYDLTCRLSLEGGYASDSADISPNKLFKIADIIDETKTALNFNTGGLVLTGSLCARCAETIDS